MRVHATITVKVVYDDAASLAQVRGQATRAADHLVQLGMMEGIWSGDTPLTVDEATFDVKVVQPHGSGDMRRAPKKRSSRRGSRRHR
jgi:hypothetical protein